MAGLVQNFIDGYTYISDEAASPITKNWFLVSKPYQLIGLLIFYLYFSIRLGPRYMRHRKPYDLKNVIKFFNIFQVILNSYLVWVGVYYMSSKEFSFRCQNLDDPQTPRAIWIAKGAWVYFFSKLVDLVDTVFFVLRKSNRQISSLHLHHHTLMPVVTWIGVTYYPGGQSTIIAPTNSFVHAVMYTYYYMAGLGDEYKKYLWWKKYVTTLQLIQFVVIGLHSANSLFYECGYPTWIKIGMIIYSGIFINMFGQFYYYTYIVKKSKAKRREADNSIKECHKNGKETLSETANGHQNGIEADSETVENNYKNGKDAKAQISNGFTNHSKTQ